MPLSNDERGWVMTGLSGLACVLGASVICVDIIVRQFPGKRDFKIQQSDTFLSASLSLSFGVMLFSSLYSILPSAKRSLVAGGFSPKAAAWTLIACFIGGVVGIQILSNIMHRFIPSHVVDCEHSHMGDDDKEHASPHEHGGRQRSISSGKKSFTEHAPEDALDFSYGTNPSGDSPTQAGSGSQQRGEGPPGSCGSSKRPSLQQRLTTGLSVLGSGKVDCGSEGPCLGFTGPCAEDCFQTVQSRGGVRASTRRSSGHSTRPTTGKSGTAEPFFTDATESTPLLREIVEEPSKARPSSPHHAHAHSVSHGHESESSSSETAHVDGTDGKLHKLHSHESRSSHKPDHHHHHVPNNAFLSIGLQTSIAIALHKLPEGFITYATNHANPKLGVAVFLALFIHNITEGFALALPLYLAIGSRIKAMVWSFVLGGLSQPAGAAIAALWFKIAGSSGYQPSEGVYGGMFAVTAGIMTSVALQLFSESLDLTHSKSLCMIGAFSGMAILGISSALTA